MADFQQISEARQWLGLGETATLKQVEGPINGQLIAIILISVKTRIK